MKKLFLFNYSQKFINILISFSLSICVFLWFPQKDISSLFASLLILLIIYWLLQKWVSPIILSRLKEYTIYWRAGIIGISLLVGLWLSLNIPLPTPPVERTPFFPPLVVRLAYRLFSGMGLGLFVLAGSVLMAKIRFETPSLNEKTPKFSFIKYFLPMVLIWGIYLLAFYPGMMSADSFNQWKQVLTGVYVDHHPPFHTFTIWLATRLALTPTSVAVAQILFLGFVATQWFVFFESIRLPRVFIWLGWFLFTLSPINGTMVNTLWKDIPFSTSVLALSLILAKIVYSRGEWIRGWKAKIVLGVVCALVLLFRHDGLPLGIGSLAGLMIFYPRRWKSWVVATVICFGIYFGVRGPLYEAVGVQKSTVLAESSLSLYSMAAYAKPASQAEKLIESFAIITPDFRCPIGDKISPDWRTTDLDYSLSPIEVAGNLVQRLPRVLIYFYRCARSMEWIVWDPYGEVRNASHVEVLVDANPYGIQHDSKIPWLRDLIRDWVIKTSHDPNLNWFFWRPAFFLYVNLFVILVLILRYRSIKFGLIALPILLQSVTFSLIFAEPNFRYHYAVYLVSLVSWPLIFSSPHQLPDEQKLG